eukprot:TRINITY_DN33015_c0_g1_i1.p1 TRINITY_DN33015_c0_g1~~TRINITY_DN33015_c0_g1_i1.p1  ORF type:complete len:221 (+),score=41.01 TRINITY_DN33015_c0_g1_i1:49-663(+)
MCEPFGEYDVSTRPMPSAAMATSGDVGDARSPANTPKRLDACHFRTSPATLPALLGRTRAERGRHDDAVAPYLDSKMLRMHTQKQQGVQRISPNSYQSVPVPPPPPATSVGAEATAAPERAKAASSSLASGISKDSQRQYQQRLQRLLPAGFLSSTSKSSAGESARGVVNESVPSRSLFAEAGLQVARAVALGKLRFNDAVSSW